MKTLLLFYSYGGNTRKIAYLIQKIVDCDIEEVKTVKPYTTDYNSVVNQGQQEINAGFMPEIEPPKVDIPSYDRIILGSPVWWYTFTPAMKTFLHENSLAGKEIYPFATNGGWIGHTFKDYENSCPGAFIKTALNVKFNEHTLCTPDSVIEKWADKIRLHNQ